MAECGAKRGECVGGDEGFQIVLGGVDEGLLLSASEAGGDEGVLSEGAASAIDAGL
jgi:hypothetical protein